jgi:uncharacterized membrane protein
MKKWVLFNYVLIVLLQVVDLVTTDIGVNHLGASEMNPIVSMVVHNVLYFTLFKLGITSILIWAFERCRKRSMKDFKILMIIYYVTMGLVIINNISYILLLLSI